MQCNDSDYSVVQKPRENCCLEGRKSDLVMWAELCSTETYWELSMGLRWHWKYVAVGAPSQ